MSAENYAVFRRRGDEDERPVAVIAGFSSEGHAKHYATQTYGLVRDPRGGPLVLKLEQLDEGELQKTLKEYERVEAERAAEAKRIAKERAEANAAKERERRIAELTEEMERQAFLKQREEWRKQAETELAKEESEGSTGN